MIDLTNKTALITGATGHLGSSIAHSLASAGSTVYINSRDSNKVKLLCKDLNSKGFKAQGAHFDITNLNEVKNFFENTNIDKLDILINNAYQGKGGTINTALTKDFIDSYEIAVIAAHNLIKLSKTLLINAKNINGDASIINVASMYGTVSPDLRIYDSEEESNPPFYGAAKAALIQYTRYAAGEYASKGIRVNAITPGPFPSLNVQKENPNFIKKLENKVPLGRIGKSEEIGPIVAFLSSDLASYITGAVIPVDGGWTSC